MLSFAVGAQTVKVYPADAPGRPVIYLNTFAAEGGQVYAALQSGGCPDFSLVAVSGLDWEQDMAPWDAAPVFSGGTPCTGGADAYLRRLCETILPRAEQAIGFPVSWRAIAGYSLAGLFAVYSVYKTDAFARVASVSGSLWFPGLKEYICTHAPKRTPDHMYFSLGDRECKTRNPVLQCVQENTQAIESFYRSQGIDTVFCLHPGNHYKNATARSATGLRWLLER